MKDALEKMPETAKPAWNMIIVELEARSPGGMR
jgi:hypothetical protein